MIKKLKKLRLNTKVMFLVGLLIGLIISATGIYAATLVDSVNVTYDNSTSLLESDNVQDALDELYGMCMTTSLEGAALYITSLYSNTVRTSVTTAGDEAITQATDKSLMQDSYGNIRYYGASPNNYVSFNDELWRIIGVFEVEDENGNIEKRVKIIRSSTIGQYLFDNKQSGYGSSVSEYGSNDWSDARLMMLLNPGYEDGATDSSGNTIYEYEGSLYWNSKSGTYYASSGTTTVDFTSTGLSDEAKSLIGQAKYYLGGYDTFYLKYADDIYAMERGTDVYGENATDWTGYIALGYASDYLYAGDLTVCTLVVSSYNDDSTNCLEENWLISDFNNNRNGSTYLYLFPPNMGSTSSVATLTATYYVTKYSYYTPFGGLYTQNAAAIIPVVYLNSDVIITGGSGTSSDPYTLASG